MLHFFLTNLFIPHKACKRCFNNSFTFVFTNSTVLKKINISNVNALQFFQLIRYGAFLLIGILFSKSELGKNNIGLYETFLLIAGALTFFWVNGFLKAMLPMAAERKESDRPILLFNSFVVLLSCAALSALVLLAFNKPISTLLLNGGNVPMPLLLAGYILLNSPALIIEYIYLANNRSKSIIAYGTITFGLQIIVVGLPPFFGLSLNWVIIGLIGVTIFKFIWLIFVLVNYSKAKVELKIIVEFLKTGAPLVLSTLLSSSARYIDGFIITSQFTPDDFAIFQYGARELPLALLLANSLSMAMLPRLAQNNLESPLAEFKSEVFRLHWLLFPLTLVLLFSSHWFFPLVFNPEFESSATIFNIYLLLIISRLLFPQTLLTAKKYNGVLVKASLFEIIINVTSSLILANLIGIEGVAYGTFIAYIAEKIYLMVALKNILNVEVSKYLPLKMYIISSFTTIIVFIIVEFLIY